MIELANVVLKRWKLIAGLPLATAVVAAIVVLIIPAKFTAKASFVPESESKGLSLPSGLAGLAGQIGLALPVGGANSPKFYVGVMESRTLRDSVLLAVFPDPRTDEVADSASLVDILDVEGETEEMRLEKGREKLEDRTTFRVDAETNVVDVLVETRWPELSAAIANYHLALLNTFNLETRQSNARERRRFVEGRLAAAEDELRAAEEDLKQFLERNRQFRGSPELQFQFDRLERGVSMKQEVVATLRRQYEESRIQEVNDTPVLTVIDRAVPPQEKSSPHRTLVVIIAFLMGSLLAVSLVYTREQVDRAREREEEEFRELTSRWSAVRTELRSLFRRRRSSR